MAGSFTLGFTFSGEGSATARAAGAFALGFTFAATPAEQQPACRYLTPRDLENACGGAAVVDRLFDFDGDGVRDHGPLAMAMRGAEDYAASYLLKSWTNEEIAVIGRTDLGFRMHVAWVAMELGVEMKPEFNGADGKGRYWTQYERAGNHFDRMAKNKAHTVAADAGAGRGAQSGGSISPTLDPATSPRFTFTPDRNNPTRGGF